MFNLFKNKLKFESLKADRQNFLSFKSNFPKYNYNQEKYLSPNLKFYCTSIYLEYDLIFYFRLLQTSRLAAETAIEGERNNGDGGRSFKHKR